MNDNLNFVIIDGIKCYNPEVADAYSDYPDNGFDLTDSNRIADSSFWVSSRNRLFKRMVQLNLPADRSAKFLDIGCATGDFIQQIVHNKNLEITGSEIYLKGLKYAKRNLPGVDFVQYDVTQGKIGNNFDVITSFDVIEHIENDSIAIKNMYDMLSNNGVLILSVPQHMFLWSKLDDIVKHKRRYTRHDLVSKLKENGFHVSFITSYLFVLFPLMLISRVFDKIRSQTNSEKIEFERRVTFSPVINKIFNQLMRVDEILIKFGLSLPFGGTLVVVARKL